VQKLQIVRKYEERNFDKASLSPSAELIRDFCANMITLFKEILA
jgi:hypothetical protein